MVNIFRKKLVFRRSLLTLLIIILLLNLCTFIVVSELSYSLVIKILNRKHNAPFFIAIYDHKKSFLKPNLAKYAFLIDGNEQDIYVLDNISAGIYAVAVFQDINRNGRLDTSLFGLPKEPFGFSNNPRLLLGAPAFKDCQILLFDDTIIEIKLR